jgi:RNA polymerase sigma-70 factor (ECF subfamily)
VGSPAFPISTDTAALSSGCAAAAACSDEELARSAQEGSLEALEELVRRYQVPLLRFLRRGPCPREAEDVLQETWLRAMRSLDRYRAGKPFKPWIFTVCYRLAVDFARKRTPNPLVELTSSNPSPGPGPAERVERAEWAERFWATVRDVLGEECFTAAWLQYGESMPPREVAKVLGRSQVWVRTMLYRSRKRLSPLFEDAPFAPAKSGDNRPGWSYDLTKLEACEDRARR